MDRRRLIYCVVALIGVSTILVAFALIVGPEIGVQKDIAASETTNAPDLLIDNIASVQYPDPLHLRLPDGRLFRFSQIVCPDAGTPEYAQALELVPQALAFHGNLKKGLRVLGTDTAGARLAEPWGFQLEIAMCGNLTSAEARSLRVPHWKNLTVWLVSSGLFWLEAGVTDPGLLAAQSAARKQGLGIWANPLYLRRLVNLAECEALLNRPTQPWGPELRDRRLESAELLLRTDPEAYVPRLLGVIKDPKEMDIFVRVGIAERLDTAGHKEGTEFLMEAVRQGGLTESEINFIKLEYPRFLLQRAMERENAAIAAYNSALRRQAAGDLPGAIVDLQKALVEAPPGWPHRGAAADRLKQLKGKP